MSKVMIVEDDDGLREIYGIRLTAEGYEVVSARDGEEALAVAIKERPDLIVSDVMMPKISGFDMLDILRSTPETRNIRIIMMTALSSDDQRERGENLGADRYLVKSQVGIEDVVNVVHEVLGDRSNDGMINQGPAVASAQNLQTSFAPNTASTVPESLTNTTPVNPAPTESPIPSNTVAPGVIPDQTVPTAFVAPTTPTPIPPEIQPPVV